MTHEDYGIRARSRPCLGVLPPRGEVPVAGHCVDRAGQIIGRGRNRREETKPPG